MAQDIKQDTTQILAELARLQAQLSPEAIASVTKDVESRTFMLQRYLDGLTSYAETVIDGTVEVESLGDEIPVASDRLGSDAIEDEAQGLSHRRNSPDGGVKENPKGKNPSRSTNRGEVRLDEGDVNRNVQQSDDPLQPIAGYEGVRVAEDAFIKDEDSNRVGNLIQGDLDRLSGHAVDGHGNIIDKNGNVEGHAVPREKEEVGIHESRVEENTSSQKRSSARRASSKVMASRSTTTKTTQLLTPPEFPGLSPGNRLRKMNIVDFGTACAAVANLSTGDENSFISVDVPIVLHPNPTQPLQESFETPERYYIRISVWNSSLTRAFTNGVSLRPSLFESRRMINILVFIQIDMMGANCLANVLSVARDSWLLRRRRSTLFCFYSLPDSHRDEIDAGCWEFLKNMGVVSARVPSLKTDKTALFEANSQAYSNSKVALWLTGLLVNQQLLAQNFKSW